MSHLLRVFANSEIHLACTYMATHTLMRSPGDGHMLALLTPNLLAAVCLFFEFSLSPTCFFNYTLPCVLSEYIIQNEVHLEDIKITNARHHSHNFNLAWCWFWFWHCFISYVLSILPQSAVCLLPSRITVIPIGFFSFLLMNADPCVLSQRVPLRMTKKIVLITIKSLHWRAGTRNLTESRPLFCSGSQ